MRGLHWQEVSVLPELFCLGGQKGCQRCPHHYRQPRAVLHGPGIADQGSRSGDLASCARDSLDEAHELESVASESFGLSVSNRRIAELVSDALKAVSGRSRAIHVEALGSELIERFDLLCRLLSVDKEATRVAFENRKAFRLKNFEICNGVLSSLERFIRELEMVPGFEDDTGINERSKQIYAELRYPLECDDRGSIFWIERRATGLGKGFNTHLIATPIDVSEILGERLFGSYNVTVLCSATLAVQAKFEHIHRSLGVGDASELIVPSSFDYEKQAVRYLPPDIPNPRDESYFERAKAVTLLS